jgi:anti-sigma factor RsiW
MTDLETRLAAFADGELDRPQAKEVERILATDAQARRSVRIHREMTALLRGAFAEVNYVPSREAADRLVASRPRSKHPSRPLMAIAASLIFAVISFVAGSYLGRPATTHELTDLLDEVSAYHLVFSRETDHLVEVPASRSAELAAWLGDRLGRKLNIPDLSSAGLTFAGGRMLVVNGRPVAQLLYTEPGQMPVGICITRTVDRPSELKIVKRHGLDLAWWVEGLYAYIVVGMLPGERAKALADLVATAAPG